jgi:exopolysaccharide biosynthesis polyprenyl glycosylphosphotransferase
VLGTTKELAAVINRERLQRILVFEGCVSNGDLLECTRISRRMGVIVSRSITGTHPETRLELSVLAGVPLLEWKPVCFNRQQEVLKRAFDIVVASFTLVVLSPLLILLAILIKLTSPGPILYKSRRVGRGGRHFNFLKFRSMIVGGENRRHLQRLNEMSGHLFKIRKDPRVTPFGRFMRRYSLDELPQLVNVLRGEMSLVGPRPLPAEDLDPAGQSREFKFWAEERYRVPPGLTGLWQVRGRSDLPFEKMTELDIYYIQNWSLLVDFHIMLLTPLVVLSGRGAY